MADMYPPQHVAEAFVKQYYMILNKCPHNAHKFYKEPSILGWPGPDGVMTNVTTLNGISDKIMSEDFKNCMVEVKTTDAQRSLDGAVIVAVTGYSIGTNDVKMNFSQTFFLAKQENGFYVMNDILRFSEPIANTEAAKDDEPNDHQPAPVVQVSVALDIPDSPPPSPKPVVENGNANEDNFPILEKPVAKQASPKPPVICALAAHVKEEPKKVTYASMVAKVSSPKATSSAQLSDGAPKVSSPSRAPAALSKAAPKLATPSVGAPKVSSPSRAPAAKSKAARKLATPSDGPPKVSSPYRAPAAMSKAAPKLAKPSNGAPNNGPYAEARGIYIGRLPYEITKQGIVEVIKQFGPVRRNADNIQIRKHDDGFVCGFLEFESAESARRAVETHYVYFGDKEAYITYRRSAYGGGKDGKGKSPSRIGVGNGRGNGASNKKGPARSPRRR